MHERSPDLVCVCFVGSGEVCIDRFNYEHQPKVHFSTKITNSDALSVP